MIQSFLSHLARVVRRILTPFFILVLWSLIVVSACGQKGISGIPHHEPASGPVLFPDDLPPDATISAGTMRGAFSVSSSGEAMYTLPLVVPPGRAGMQPSLALTYDSAGFDGPVGKGFSISGLSAVTRCTHNVAQDGFTGVLTYDKADALCLDGRRLIQIKTKNIDDADEYRTLPDTFSRVLAYFPAGWDRELGPEHFEVHTKSGLTVAYGGSPDSKALAKSGAVRTWWINQSTDRNQNSILYSYENDKDPSGSFTTEIVPAAIRYTDHPSAPASRAVVFDYHSRPDSAVRTLFTQGMALTNTKLLTGIRTLGPGDALVREVYLSYESSGDTAQPLLSRVEECAADKVCKPPTTFGWNILAPGFTRITTPLKVPTSANAEVMALDANGDGLDDLAISDIPLIGGAPQATTHWNVALNTGPGALAPTFFPATTLVAKSELTLSPEQGTPIDYNGDGRTDIFVHDVEGLFNTWQILLAQPDHTFQRLDTGIAREFGNGGDARPPLVGPSASAHLADVNGDGVADLLQCSFDGVDHHWTLNLWTPDGPGFSKTAFKGPDILINFPCDTEFYTVDVDGDGKVDLVMRETSVVDDPNGAKTILVDNYLAFSHLHDDLWATTDLKLPAPGLGGGLFFLDVNGDGLPDAVETGLDDQQPRTLINTGKGFSAPVKSLRNAVPAADQFASLAVPIDFNNDGLQDMLLPMLLNGSGAPVWAVLESTGTVGDGTFRIVETSIPFDGTFLAGGVTLSDPHGPRVIDVDGDGSGDVVLPIKGVFNVFRNNAVDQAMLVSVTDGMNAHEPGEGGFVPDVAITYENLIDASITKGVSQDAPGRDSYHYLSHEDASNDCAYPLRCVAGSRRVVGHYALNNGQGQLRHFGVRYRDGRYDRLGKRFLDFGERILLDEDTGAGSAEIYDNITFDPTFNVFPYAGQVVRERRWTPGLPTQPNPDRIELSYTSAMMQTVLTNDGKTYFTLPVARTVSREQGIFPPPGQPDATLEQYVRDTEVFPATVLDQTTRTISDYDLYGNILVEDTSAPGVDLKLNIKRVFPIDEGAWRIGEMTELHECSTAMQTTQCRTTTLTYDGLGQVKTTSRGSDDGNLETKLSLSFDYDTFGNIVGTGAKDGSRTRREASIFYEEDGIFPFAQKNAAGHVSTMKFDPGLGVQKAFTDPNNLTTQWGYDGLGRMTKEVRPDKTMTTYTLSRAREQYNEWTVKLETKSDGGDDSTVQFDSLGRVVRRWSQGVAVGGVPAQRVVQTIMFDELGEHVARRSMPTGELTSPDKMLYDEFEYDAAGRVVKHEAPWGAVTTYDYEGADVLVTGPGPMFATTLAHNDGLGRPVLVQDTAGSTSYVYGPFGGLYSVTDPGGDVTTTERDAYGRVWKTVDPDRKTTIAHYSGFGELTSSTDAQNRTINYYHDELGRLTVRTDDDGETTWTWDTEVHGVGKIAQVKSPDGHTVTTKYNDLSLPSVHRLSVNGDLFELTLGYDPYSRLGSITYPPDGKGPLTVKNEYDDYGHLLTVKDAATTYWALTGTDSAGRITGEAFGNGVTTTVRGWDEARDRVKSISTKANGLALQDLSYGYDDKLNLSSRTDLSQGITESFTYDELDRLKCASFTLGSCEQQIEYKPNGNIDWTKALGQYTYDPNHPHAVETAGGDTYEYDDTGNQIKRPGATIGYTAFDKPKTITLSGSGGKVTLEYDGDQQRVRKTTEGTGADTETVYLSDFYERVTHKDTGIVEYRYYIHAGERAVAMVTVPSVGKSATRYFHVDHLGSVDVLSDEGGVEHDRRSYDAFGARRNPKWGQAPPASFSSETERGFTWHEQDEELGLVNMKGRIYDPKVGRFLTPDPVVSNPMFGQSWNAYSYVLNNPLAYVDPSGFEPEGTRPYAVGGNVTTDGNGTQTIWVTGPSLAELAQGRANAEAMRTGSSPVPTDVNTIGTTVGFVPQCSPTALEQSTATQTTSADDEDGDPSWVQHPVVQIEGGFIGGLALGYVPLVGPAVSLGSRWAIGPGTRQAQIGKAIGEIVGGFLLGVGGLGLTLTGGGAPAGVAAIAASVGLVAAGLTSIGVGAWEYNQAMMSKGSGSGGPAPPRNGHLAGQEHPKTNVPFDAKGYPDFKAAGLVKAEVKITLTGSRQADSMAANKAAGYDKTPEGYTWHHHQDGTTMQLVPIGPHKYTGHTGGFSR